jgi:hypothetical protein
MIAPLEDGLSYRPKHVVENEKKIVVTGKK